MGAKQSYVATTQRRLLTQAALKRQLADTHSHATAEQLEIEARQMVSVEQLLRHLEVDEESDIARWEVLQFIRYEMETWMNRMRLANQTGGSLDSLSVSLSHTPPPSHYQPSESQMVALNELCVKLQQLCRRMDKPAGRRDRDELTWMQSESKQQPPMTLVTGSMTARQTTEASRPSLRHGTITPVPPLRFPSANHASAAPRSYAHTARSSSTRSHHDAGFHSARLRPQSQPFTAAPSPFAGLLTPFASDPRTPFRVGFSDVRSTMSRDELIHQFRDLTNDEIDLLTNAALERSKLLHSRKHSLPPSTIHPSSHPDHLHVRWLDLFRQLWSALDTTHRCFVSAHQIRTWMLGSLPGIGGRSVNNAFLRATARSLESDARLQAQMRILCNKLNDNHQYTKPEFEALFARWSLEDVREVASPLIEAVAQSAAQFQEDLRRSAAMTKRIESATRRATQEREKMMERRRMILMQQRAAAIARTNTNGAADSTSLPPLFSVSFDTAQQPGTADSSMHSSSVTSPSPPPNRWRNAGAGGGTSGGVDDRGGDTSYSRDHENASKRKSLAEAEIKRAEARQQLLERDRERESRCTPDHAEAFMRELKALLQDAAHVHAQQQQGGNEDGMVGSHEHHHTQSSRFDFSSHGPSSSFSAFDPSSLTSSNSSSSISNSSSILPDIDSFSRLCSQHSISRPRAARCLKSVGVNVELFRRRFVAIASSSSHPHHAIEMEPLCIRCLLQNSTHITRECQHLCCCLDCATFIMTLPPHRRRCPVCRAPISQIRKCVWQQWK